MSTNKTPAELFWSKVNKTSTCWLWTASTRGKGYGGFHSHGVMYAAHRFSWILKHGSVPEGLHVLHRCDNPACVRPSHLFLGTNADNVADKMSKKRHRNLQGEKHPLSKLTDQDVKQIRKLQSEGALHRELAKQFNVTKGTIGFIIRQETWTHI